MTHFHCTDPKCFFNSDDPQQAHSHGVDTGHEVEPEAAG